MSPEWSYLLTTALLPSLAPKIALAGHDRDHGDDHDRGHAYGHERHDRDDDAIATAAITVITIVSCTNGMKLTATIYHLALPSAINCPRDSSVS